MTLARRLGQAEQQLGVRENDPDADVKEVWGAFWGWFQEVVAPWPEALALARQRVGANAGTWRSSAPPGTKLWLLSNTAWHALSDFPDALRAAEESFAQLEAAVRGGGAA